MKRIEYLHVYGVFTVYQEAFYGQKLHLKQVTLQNVSDANME